MGRLHPDSPFVSQRMGIFLARSPQMIMPVVQIKQATACLQTNDTLFRLLVIIATLVNILNLDLQTDRCTYNQKALRHRLA